MDAILLLLVTAVTTATAAAGVAWLRHDNTNQRA